MIQKTSICARCNASFVVETRGQVLCDECLAEELETDPKEKQKHKPIYKKNYRRLKGGNTN